MRSLRLVGPVIASIMLFGFAGRACADAGLPAPSLNVTFQFTHLEDYPKYDFYVKYRLGFPGQKEGKPRLDAVTAGTPFHLTGRRSGLSEVFLIAVPRGQDMSALKDVKGTWLHDPPAGGLQSPALKGDDAGAALGDYSGYDITYRVRIDGERLEVEWVESNLNEWWSHVRLTAILIGAACVLVPLGIIALVVVVIVRWSRRPSSEPDAPRFTRRFRHQ